MTTIQTTTEITNTAKSLRVLAKLKGEKVIEINHSLPYVAINLPDNRQYFFQGEEAHQLLDEAVEAGWKFGTFVEDTILWFSQSW